MVRESKNYIWVNSSNLNMCVCVSRSVVPNSLRPHLLQSTRFLCPWDFPGKDTGVGCHLLLQGIFPTQRLNPGLLHCRQILYQPSYKGITHCWLPLHLACYLSSCSPAPGAEDVFWRNSALSTPFPKFSAIDFSLIGLLPGDQPSWWDGKLIIWAKAGIKWCSFDQQETHTSLPTWNVLVQAVHLIFQFYLFLCSCLLKKLNDRKVEG